MPSFKVVRFFNLWKWLFVLCGLISAAPGNEAKLESNETKYSQVQNLNHSRCTFPHCLTGKPVSNAQCKQRIIKYIEYCLTGNCLYWKAPSSEIRFCQQVNLTVSKNLVNYSTLHWGESMPLLLLKFYKCFPLWYLYCKLQHMQPLILSYSLCWMCYWSP